MTKTHFTSLNASHLRALADSLDSEIPKHLRAKRWHSRIINHSNSPRAIITAKKERARHVLMLRELREQRASLHTLIRNLQDNTTHQFN